MKKLMMVLVSLMVIMSFAACSAEFVDPIAKSAEEFQKTGEATHIHQTVEVIDGTLAMFVHEKDYVFSGNKFTVTETRKTLNAAGSEEPYSVEYENTDKVDKAETFASNLKLENRFFKAGYYTSGNYFRGGVKDNFVNEMFGFKSNHATMNNVVLEMTSSGDKLTQMVITYASDEDTNVKITISFEY